MLHSNNCSSNVKMVTANILNQIYAITSFTSSSKITLINHMEQAERLKLCYRDFQKFWKFKVYSDKQKFSYNMETHHKLNKLVPVKWFYHYNGCQSKIKSQIIPTIILNGQC